MKPFLKWAGNKYQIIETIRAHLPRGGRLIEPFVGSGAVFLNVPFPAYYLSDANADLISLFRHLQAEGDAFIDDCRRYFVPETNDAATYYRLRERFNATADSRDKAALFLYLNKHAYNGLCRYNLSGEFNAPFGRYKKPYFPAREMRTFHERAQAAEFVTGNYLAAMAQARPGDVVYCDPPYVPLSATANFTSYCVGGFGPDDQQALAQMARRLASRGVAVLVSNHDLDVTRSAYDGAHITSFDVRRTISCNGRARSKVRELLALFLPAPHERPERSHRSHATPLQPLAGD